MRLYQSRFLRWLRPRWGWGLLVALGACHPTDPALGEYVGDEVTHNDFEMVRGWYPADTAALSTVRAHAGRYATRVDANHEFGLTYNATLREASVHTLRAVEAEAWVWLPSARADAALELQVWPAGAAAPSHHETFRLLDQAMLFGQWQRVQHIFKLPTGLGTEDRLRLFLWRSASPEPVYLDDLRVKARE